MRVIVIVFMCLTLGKGKSIKFDLSSYDPNNQTTEVFKQYVDFTKDVTKIKLENVPSNMGFLIIQVHSYVNDVILSSTESPEAKSFVTGSNIGFVYSHKNDTIFYVHSDNITSSLVVIIIYGETDPIPGGCNLTFDTEIAPYQIVNDTDELTIVKSQAPYVVGSTCEKNNIQVDLYHFYLPEADFDKSTYFDGIESMMTVDAIKTNGFKVNTVDGYYKYRKLYSAYRGVGHVFAIIATFNHKSAAYIPAVSYGCDLNNQWETCNGPVTPHWKALCAVLFIFGFFMCIFGHIYFRMTLYLIGFSLGVAVTYVVLTFTMDLSVPEMTTGAIIVGLVYASIWLLIWWKFGIPILSASATFVLAAFLLGSVIAYAGLADYFIFRNDVNFWFTQTSIILAFLIIWTMFTLHGHIFACSLLGSYACITALNYYVGGNLQYIIINAYRRIAIKEFNMATIDAPFQRMDVWQTILWIVMLAFGFCYQLREQFGKPPFPPPRSVSAHEGQRVNETTPLLHPIYP